MQRATSIAQSIDRVSLQRDLVQAVLALDPSYRAVVVLRYFEGCSSAEIAQRLGLTPGAVRTRLSRALASLRTRLEADYADERGGWRAGVASLASGLGADKASASAWGTWLVALPIAAVAMAVIGLWAMSARTSQPRVPGAVVPGDGGLLVGGHEKSGAELQSPEPGRAPVVRDSRAPSDATPTPPAEIRARFLLEDGAPAIGLACRLKGWSRGEEDERLYGAPDEWPDSVHVVDSNGRLALRFVPPPAYQFTLVAELDGYSAVHWRWSRIRPGQVEDLSTVQLTRGGSLEGQAPPGSDGQAGWRVRVVSHPPGVDQRRSLVTTYAPVDPETGAYRFENLPAGAARARLVSSLASDQPELGVEILSGETTRLDLPYLGPDLSRRIRLATRTHGFPFDGGPDPDRVMLRLQNGTSRRPDSVARHGQFDFDNVEPGLHTLWVDDPRYESWSTEARPGTRVSASLSGSAMLAIEGVDGESKEPLASFSVAVVVDDQERRPLEVRLPLDAGEQPGALRVPPGHVLLRARAPGYVAREIDVGQLGAGELERLTIELSPARGLEGRLTLSDGTPVAGEEVRVYSTARIGDSPSSPLLEPGDPEFPSDSARLLVGVQVTDATGAFRFDLDGGGSYVLHSVLGRFLEVKSSVLRTQADEQRTVSDCVFPPSGRLLGRIEPSLGECGICVLPDSRAPEPGWGEAQRRMRWMRRLSDGVVGVDEEGRFQTGPLPSGPATVYLVAPWPRSSIGVDGRGRVDGAIELARVEIVEQAQAERVFSAPDSFLGSLSLRLRVNGDVATGVKARLTSEGGVRIELTPGPEGVVGPMRLPSGQWTLTVEHEQPIWVYRHPVAFCLDADRPAVEDVEIRVVRAPLQVVDLDGRPLANDGIWVESRTAGYSTGPLDTDERGRLVLTLPVGSYALLKANSEDPEGFPDENRRAAFDWTKDGPAVERVEL